MFGVVDDACCCCLLLFVVVVVEGCFTAAALVEDAIVAIAGVVQTNQLYLPSHLSIRPSPSLSIHPLSTAATPSATTGT